MRNSTLAAEMARAGMDCVQLGSRTGTCAQTLRNLVNGKQLPTRQTAENIASALGQKPEDLFPAISTRTAYNTRRRRQMKAGVAHV